MGFREYTPSPVLIPETLGLRRAFASPKSTVGGPDLSDADYAEYDSRTIFYDVFRRDREGDVLAIGPPPVNLAGELAQLEISCAGQPLRYACRQHPNFCLLAIQDGQEGQRGPEAGKDAEEDLILRFRFPSFEATVAVPPDPDPPPPTASGMALVTLQKDTPVNWVTDWCLWHHRLHGVSRIAFYDNGSSNVATLGSALSGLDDALEIVFVHWPFPWGPGRSDKNRFCKAGMQNHYRLLFGRFDAWCGSLDIDEYLVVDGPGTLPERLAGWDRENVAAVLIDSWNVPPYEGQPVAEDRRAGLHDFRDRVPAGYALKYLFKPARIVCNRTHIAYPENRFWSAFARFPRLSSKLQQLFYGSLLKRLANTGWLRRFYPSWTGFRHLPVDSMFLWHFRGLNTNWRPERNLGEEIQAFDPAHHERDPRIGALARRAGLMDERD